MPATQRLRRSVFEWLWSAPVKRWLERTPYVRRLYNGWSRQHPFDVAEGIDASGFVPSSGYAAGRADAAEINPYGGSQPSILRRVLAAVPEPQRFAFVDIGCGKGRPLVVASEFPFQRIVGVELSEQLAAIARANAATVAARHPQRTPIEIRIADATTVDAPGERVVYFLYNSFGRSLVEALVRNIEQQLQSGRVAQALFVFYNPVHGEVLDQSPLFSRWLAQTLPYADDELGYGPDLEDPVVVWQSLPAVLPCDASAGQRIRVFHSMRCQLEAV